MKFKNLFGIVAVLLVVAISATSAMAQCSSGGCSQSSSVSVSQNDAIIDQQNQQIQQLQQQINDLGAILQQRVQIAQLQRSLQTQVARQNLKGVEQNLVTTRGLDSGIVQIGEDDQVVKVQRVQSVLPPPQPQVRVQAPITRVQVIQPQARASVSSRWQR